MARNHTLKGADSKGRIFHMNECLKGRKFAIPNDSKDRIFERHNDYKGRIIQRPNNLEVGILKCLKDLQDQSFTLDGQER